MIAPVSSGSKKLRIARPSDDLAKLVAFYRDGLGFSVLGRFDDHDGFDGVMLGHPDQPYHLEFTHHHGRAVGRAPTRENLLVFYFPEEGAWLAALDRMLDAGFVAVPSENPYWDRQGKTFEDPDGYRIVLQQGDWPQAPTMIDVDELG